MTRRPPILTRLLRVLTDSDWDESVHMRWAAQLAVGALPGLIIVLTIMHLAGSAPREHNGGTSAASIVPLLSASTLVDTAAFHRVAHTDSPVASSVQFRAPRADRVSSVKKRVLTVSKRTSPLPVNFKSPRQQWNYLDTNVRKVVDAGVSGADVKQRVVLHGSGGTHGNVRLIERYNASVRGMSEGLGYDFVIGNGNGSADGSIAIGQAWQKTTPTGNSPESKLRESSVSVCLVGDFQSAPPTAAQLAALDELIDYLAIKLGSLPVTTHEAFKGEPTRCLGAKFPTEQILRAISE